MGMTDLNITANTADLKAIVEGNKEKHLKDFQKAWTLFQGAAEAWFTEQLKRVKKGKTADRVMPHPIPQEHTKDYEQVIGMLGMHSEEFIDIDWMTYRQFVDDEWGWSHEFSTTNTYYASMGS